MADLPIPLGLLEVADKLRPAADFWILNLGLSAAALALSMTHRVARIALALAAICWAGIQSMVVLTDPLRADILREVGWSHYGHTAASAWLPLLACVLGLRVQFALRSLLDGSRAAPPLRP